MPLALLDTDILSKLIKLRNPAVTQHAADYTQQVGPLAFSAITRYEILRGMKSRGATTQLACFRVYWEN